MDDAPNFHFSRKIFLISLVFLLVNASWISVRALQGGGAGATRVAPVLTFAKGAEVMFQDVYDASPVPAQNGQSVPAGARITTGVDSVAELTAGYAVLHLEPGSKLRLKDSLFVADAFVPTEPQTVWSLEEGAVWIKTLVRADVETAQSAAAFFQGLGRVSYSRTLNQVQVVSGSADLFLKDPSGTILNHYLLPPQHQAVFADRQLIPDYARLQPSKLKKELKLSFVPQDVLTGEWATTHGLWTADPTFSVQAPAAVSETWLALQQHFTFLAPSEKKLLEKQALADLAYLTGGEGNIADLDSRWTAFLPRAAELAAEPRFLNAAWSAFLSLTPAPLDSAEERVRQRLREFLTDHASLRLLRTALSDAQRALADHNPAMALKFVTEWGDVWKNNASAEASWEEFESQSRMLHKLLVAYAAGVDDALLAVLDQAQQRRLDHVPESDETLFAVTEERLETAGALLSAYRYEDAKAYLKNSYQSLQIDRLDTHLAARQVFLERAKLLAQRIEFAEQNLHGSASPIDESAFRAFIETKAKGDLLSNDLRRFLQVGPAQSSDFELPDTAEVVSRFSQARVSLTSSDLSPDPQSSAAFLFKNARLLDRAADGSAIVFEGSYDYVSNAVGELTVNGSPLRGNFALSDLSRILTAQGGVTPVTDTPVSIDIFGQQNEEAARARVLAEDLAIQLAIKELTKAGLQIDSPLTVQVTDHNTLKSFRIREAAIRQEDSRPLVVSFDYSSATGLISEVTLTGTDTPPLQPVSAGQFVAALRDALAGLEKKKNALNQVASLFDSQRLSWDPARIVFSGGNYTRFSFSNVTLQKLPAVSFSGSYDLNSALVIQAKTAVYSASNVSLEDFLREAVKAYGLKRLADQGVSTAGATVILSGFEGLSLQALPAGDSQVYFTFDMVQNRLVNIYVQPSAEAHDSMTFTELKALIGRLKQPAKPSLPEQPQS